MHQQKGKKILIYFFLFILAGSINNLSLSNIKFDKIKSIEVSGLNTTENLKVKKKIEDLSLKNIFFIDQSSINQTMNSNNLIEKYSVFKKYPSSIDIKITMTDFLAKINIDDKIFLVGSNGKFSDKSFINKELPFIFGKPQIEEFLNLKKILDNSKFKYKDIKNFYFYPSKRWDIELKNNMILKLPKKNIRITLDNVFKFLNDSNLINVSIIDARVQNQIIINDR